jgi:hypothetical protein
MSRSLHEEMMALVNSQVSDLKREREIIYDRLATIGLGGPLFSLPSSQDSSPVMEAEEESISEEDEEVRRIMALRRTPSKFAAAVSNYRRRKAGTIDKGPSVAWIPQAMPTKMEAALSAAVEAGKKQA